MLESVRHARQRPSVYRVLQGSGWCDGCCEWGSRCWPSTQPRYASTSQPTARPLAVGLARLPEVTDWPCAQPVGVAGELLPAQRCLSSRASASLEHLQGARNGRPSGASPRAARLAESHEDAAVCEGARRAPPAGAARRCISSNFEFCFVNERAARSGLLLRASSIDVAATPTPLDPLGKPTAPPNPVPPRCGRRRAAARSQSARAIAPPTPHRTSATAT